MAGSSLHIEEEIIFPSVENLQYIHQREIMGRRLSGGRVDKVNKGAWTALEDKVLRDYVVVHGDRRWSTVAREAGLSRCAKSCRLRWLNYLRPDIKRGNISEDEEDLIIRLHKLLGNRWCLIAGRLPGRTDNEIKNYWHTRLAKKMKARLSGEAVMSNRKHTITERSETEQPSGLLQHNITKSQCSSGIVRKDPGKMEDQDSDPELIMSPVEGPGHFETDFHAEDVDLSGINFDFISFSRLCDYEASLIGSPSNGCKNEAEEDHFAVPSSQGLPDGLLENWSSEFASMEDLIL